ncbi:mucosa-associated lymphoid tissue lymphoma translocation protein 1-like isoform X2 [Corvus hawaiiensis]|uniref:mucosa-associated lymphoid tissue lymphoma translocation protein 1-like isoform X2 n=1 Tax=Corvus hawaiiensis TaxID=134902 RepID=UPI0020194070|nr:mucosa-associated lymphoid tissue lymphoma translocation protein 1-like isoform X2 [Corvus hawaiiensis]
MGDWSMPIGSLGEEVVARLCELLDNAGRGWRKLAELAGAEKRFKCSAEELEMCSLKVLEPRGSPTQCLLQLLAERDCTLRYLLGCLERMGHEQACRVLSSAVQDMIRITVQPESQVVAEGTQVSLTCCATGPPGLTYQWFCGRQEVPGATSPELLINTATLAGQPEWYICRVNCGATFTFSRWAHVQVEKSSSPSSASGYCLTMAGLQILQQPRPCRLAEGDTLALECRAIGNPPPQYQWFRNRRPVEGAQAPQLQPPALSCWQVKLVTTAERGSYCCRVFNLFHEVWSQEVDVEIVLGALQPMPGGDAMHGVPDIPSATGPRLFTSGGSWPEGDGGSLEHGSPGQLYATDKVALLIGNMHYLHHKQLQAPIVDVHALGALLRQLDFKVVSLLDLRKAEMQMAVDEFLLLLDKGVYGATTPARAAPAQGELGGFMLVESWGAARQGAGAGRSGDATMSPPCHLPSVPPAGLLYYAGHGYENFGNSFMVPIDAPSAYTSEHCLCVQRVLREMQQRRTGLNIFLLDMCRKRNLNDDVIPQVGVLEVTANIVFGYATCADAEAYELSQGELSNGIFVTFLKRWLMEDEKITVLLDKVAEDMGTLEITRGRQALELRSNLSERRALTDPIRPPGQDESSARNLQWAKAHVLPESRHLRFNCGVSVQLGFAAEFSNIMIIYTRVVAAPKDITNCEARLTDIPEELDVDLKCTNKESPEEVGSPLAPVWSLGCPSCCLYSRICGLQKLQELAFTICLQYRYQGMDDFVEERQRVNVGRPLIAKLNLQRAASPSPPHSPLFSSPPRSWGVVGSLWVNTPEENLSPEGPSSHTL